MLKLLALAEEDISSGNYIEARSFFKEFKRDRNI